VAHLAQYAGLDDPRLVARMVQTNVDGGNLDGLAKYFELSEAEMTKLALAYALEKRR
jgi:hypothetical protein